MATWTPKPPHGARIDRSRPLAQGLVSWYPLLSGAGLPLNVISGVPATANTAPYSPSPYGPSLVCTSSPSSVYATVTNDLALNLTGPLTLICACAPSGVSGSNQVAIGTANNNAGSATVGYTWFFGHGTTETSLLLCNGSTRTIVPSSTGAIDGNPHVYAVAWDGSSTVSFYKDGDAWGSGAYASTLASTGTGGKWLGAGYLGSPPLLGPLYWFGAYDRVLSTQEIQATGADPLAIYGLLYRQPESHVLLLSTPAVTPFRPWIFGDQIEANALG